MQKSQRGLMRSAKQQKRKQKLFALSNNNNPINCRRLPGLPLLEPRARKLAYCRWFCPRCRDASPQTTPTRRLGSGLMCHPSPGLELMGKMVLIKKTQVAHIDHWEPEWMWGWNLGRARFTFETGSEFRTGKINTSKTEIMHVKGRSAFFVSWLWNHFDD